MRAGRIDGRRQRGAIGLYAAIVLILVVLFAVLAIDGARLWMTKRQMQKVADIAAVEASRAVGCHADLGDVAARAQAAAVRNGFRGDLSAAPNGVELGSVVTQEGRRHFNADGSARAVRVTATTAVPASLVAGGLFGGTVVIGASAVSLPNVPLAAFAIGGTAVSIDSRKSDLLNGLVGGMLGTTISLSAASWRGLANTDLTLARLLQAEGHNLTVDDFLDTSFSSRELLQIFSAALDLQPDLLPGVLNDVVFLADRATGGARLKLADVIGINQELREAALNANVNLLSLLMTTLMVANGNHAIDLPLGLNVLGLVSAAARITVIETPRIAIGPPADEQGNLCTVANSAQIRVDTNAGVNVALGPLLPVAAVNLDLSLEAARADAGLRAVEVADATTDLRFDESTSLVTINRDGRPLATIKVLGIPVAEIDLAVAPNAVTDTRIDVAIPRSWSFDDDGAFETGLDGRGLESLFTQPTTIALRVLGGSLLPGVLNGLLGGTVQPLLIQLSQVLLDPLLGLLGVDLGRADILIQDVIVTQPRPLVI